MRLLFLLSLIYIPVSCFTQITLNNPDFSDAGDTVRVSIAVPDSSIDYFTTGPNQNWDFSSLLAESQELRNYRDVSNASFLVQFQFGNSASVEYQASNYIENNDIPLDQLGSFLPVNISAIYGFSKNSSDSITALGYSLEIDGFEVPIQSDTIETRYKFPLNYNDSYSSRGYTYLDMNPIYNGIWIQYRQRNSVVDGWGTITTPYGTFDALRVKHEINETDSIYLDLFGTPQWISLPIPQVTEYEWIANGEYEPILRISTSAAFGNETVTEVSYKDYYLGLDASLPDLKLDVSYYPNPTADKVHFMIEGNLAFFEIITVQGEVIRSGKLNSSDIINMEDLPTGYYLVKLYSGIKSAIVPIIKQ